MGTPAPPYGPYGPMPPGQTSNYAGRNGGLYQWTQTNEEITFAGPVSVQGQIIPSPRSGVQLDVKLGYAAKFGYQPVKVTATLPRPATADRQIRFEFSAGGWGRDNQGMTVTQSFTIKRGATTASAEMLAPQYEDWQMCAWRVWVNGALDDELSTEEVATSQQNISPGVHVLLASALAHTASYYPTSLQTYGNGAHTRTTRFSDLPVDWKRYSPVDLVVLSAADVAVLTERFPDQTTALVRWVRAGGNLWLIESGQTWEKLPSVESALELSGPIADDEAASAAGSADAAILARGWRFAELSENALQPAEGALTLSGFAIEEDSDDASQTTAGPRGRRQAFVVETSQKWFAVRGLGLGVIAAFRGALEGDSSGVPDQPATADPSPESMVTGAQDPFAFGDPTLDPTVAPVPPVAGAAQRSLLAPRLAWVMRHGNQPNEANVEFNDWLIPGVGVAPVGQFQFLISLFVLGIGPLNYWWLKRRKKLPMLIAIVPTAALVVTLLLLSVGVLADGLGVRVRARSLTMLDQTKGEAATWSRLSYYAGINPRRGLSMSSDTVVYPVLSRWAEQRNSRGAASKRSLAWDDAQQLRSGWLASRTPTQYITLSARPSRRRLELRTVADGLRIVNRLGVSVTHLAVQDHDGKFYWCENLAPDAGIVAKVAKRTDVTSKLRRVFSDNEPEFPPGAEGPVFGGAYYGPQPSHNLMEAHLEAINSLAIDGWFNGSYIAVTDRGIDLDLGLDEVEEEASFHVIQGTW